MARVAIVTGGTRGIGRRFPSRLKQAGYKVAANYCGNEERAKAFTGKIGHRRLQMGCGEFRRMLAGVAKVAAEFGPVDIIVNNAGITRDATMRKMTRGGWDKVSIPISAAASTCARPRGTACWSAASAAS